MRRARDTGWLLGLVMTLSPVVVYAVETVPPTTPSNVQATVSSGDPVVTLSWAASTDASGIKGYRIERSLDQAGWKPVAELVTELSFRDTTSGFGLHYFYRLAAVDNAGNVSAWAMTDVSTEDVKTEGLGSSEATYTSRDKFVTVVMPAGAASSEISCNLNSLIDVNGHKIGDQNAPVIFGPYELACKTTAGTIVTEFKKQAAWTLNIAGTLTNGLKNPTLYVYDTGAKGEPAKNVLYDAKSETMRVSLPPNSIVAVRASRPQGVSPSLLILILVVIGLVASIVVYAVNRKRRLQYEEYLRSKYYEV